MRTIQTALGTSNRAVYAERECLANAMPFTRRKNKRRMSEKVPQSCQFNNVLGLKYLSHQRWLGLRMNLIQML